MSTPRQLYVGQKEYVRTIDPSVIIKYNVLYMIEDHYLKQERITIDTKVQTKI